MDTTSCVVTGGARGIGRGIAERMVARGHRVVITDIDGAGAAATAAEIGAAEGLQHDVRDPDAHRAVAAAAARHGVLRAWFNNAGVGDDGRLSEQTEEQVRRLVEVNLLGVLWGMRAALDGFGDGGGDIVNTASLAGFGPVPGYSVYAATKAAIVSISMSGDVETPKNVRVHAVCPDVVQTAMLTEGHTQRLAGVAARALRWPDPHRRRGGPGGRRPGGQQPGAAERAALARGSRAGLRPRPVGLQEGDEAVRGDGEARDRQAAALTGTPAGATRFEQLFGVLLELFEHTL